MSLQTLTSPRPRREWHAALWLAAMSVVAWYVALFWVSPGPIADEDEHWEVITGLTHGRWPYPGRIATLPTFHLIAAGAVKLFGESLVVVRTMNAAASLAALVFIYAAARVRHRPTAGAQVLLCAWNPLLLPYTTQVYTEASTLLVIALAIWFHVRGRAVWAAAALLVACLLRQNNIVWVAFFAAWRLADEWDEAAATGRVSPVACWRLAALAGLLRRSVRPGLRPYLGVFTVVTAYLFWHLDWALKPGPFNMAGFNVAQFWMFGFIMATLWAPLWQQRARRVWNATLGPALARPWVTARLIGAISLAAAFYCSPHPWNFSPDFLHDRFLTLLHKSLSARYLVATLIVATIPLAIGFIWDRPERHSVLAAWLFGLLFLLPHWLVDHRYHILPVLFINFCTRYTPQQTRMLCPWAGLLSLAALVYLACHAAPAAGL